MKIFSIYIVLLISFLNCRAQTQPPTIHCVQVDSLGNVTLVWQTPASAVDFHCYVIYFSNNLNGPYTAIDSIFTFTQTSYYHSGANANTHSVHYYLASRATSTGNLSTSSDSISSIYLSLFNNNNVTADLSWTNTHTPPLPGTSPMFYVYRQIQPGGWVLIDSTWNQTYTDSIKLCSAVINYKIEQANSVGCSSISNIKGDLFHDIIAPDTPWIDSVSVNNATGKITIGWDAVGNGDAAGYVIYQLVGSIWLPIDTVFGKNNTFFTDLLSDPSSAAYAYRIAAFDSCNNLSSLGVLHASMLLNNSVNICGGIASLSWTGYFNLMPALGGYHIYVSVNGGTPQLIGTNSPAEMSFQMNGLVDGNSYCFMVSAFNSTNTITASSNAECFLYERPKKPAFAYLRYATVAANSYIELAGFIDNSVSLNAIRFYRSESLMGTYALVGTLNPPFSANVSFSDFSAAVNERSYFYKMAAVDSCGDEVLSSDTLNSIFLSGNSTNYIDNLNWNYTNGWSGSTFNYEIHRSLNGIFSTVPDALVPHTGNFQYNYADDVSASNQTSGTFDYYIIANAGGGNPYGFADVCQSNQITLTETPIVYIPNAFTPDGKNPVFKPVGYFMDNQDYTFFITDRWGEKIFESHQYDVGWDGNWQGKFAKEGVYVYFLQFRNPDNSYFTQKGSVTLIR
ncbi:MAG: gliding motility-associated C-terminal domain-containing protein [Bacteroidota bacterium]